MIDLFVLQVNILKIIQKDFLKTKKIFFKKTFQKLINNHLTKGGDNILIIWNIQDSCVMISK